MVSYEFNAIFVNRKLLPVDMLRREAYYFEKMRELFVDTEYLIG
jgi:hypothetical protein